MEDEQVNFSQMKKEPKIRYFKKNKNLKNIKVQSSFKRRIFIETMNLMKKIIYFCSIQQYKINALDLLKLIPNSKFVFVISILSEVLYSTTVVNMIFFKKMQRIKILV